MPSDMRICELTGLSVHIAFTTLGARPRLQPLIAMLDGMRLPADKTATWAELAQRFARKLGSSRCEVEAATLSPNEGCLAVCLEIRTFLGLRVHHAGAVYSLIDGMVLGRIAKGKRGRQGWLPFR